MEKKCITCQEVKPIEQFREDIKNSTHRDRRSSYCDSCRATYQREYGIKRSAISSALIAAEKNERRCMDCNMLWPHVALDFDHVEGIKIVEISRAKRQTLSKVMAEIDKCDLICSNCHRIRTWNRAHPTQQLVNPYLMQPQLL